MADFVLPEINAQVDGWGPPPQAEIETPLGICDFVEHLDKFPVTRIGRICDFTAAGLRFQAERSKGKGLKGIGKGKAPIQALQPGKDAEGFSLVDSRPVPGKSHGKGRGGGSKGKSKGKGVQVNYQEGILGQKQKPFFQDNQTQGKGKGKGKGNQNRRGMPSFKEWSVQTKPDWTLMREIMLTEMAKLQLDAKAVKFEDVYWAGNMPTYSKTFDRITAKTERPLPRYEDLDFFNVTTSDDPFLPDYLQNDPEVTVIATDNVLACLVAAARSVYSWDIVVSKVANKIIFDKRDGSQIDFLTVNETAQEAPNADDKENINGPVKLGQEASCINQNFSQMVLDPDESPAELNPNPFEDEEDPDRVAAAGAFRYRKITLPGNSKGANEFEQNPVTLVVRTEVNCKMPGGEYASLKAMHEFDPKPNYNWRLHLESQRGACLATELKNNAFKLGRWTAQAILAGCDTMKIGYVSRQHPKDPWSHALLGVQTYATSGFAEQIGLTHNNMFGIIRNIVNLVMSWDDGKYLLLKDPTKSVMRIHEVPWEAFQDDEESSEEEEEEEEQELDEDGNVVPNQPAGLS